MKLKINLTATGPEELAGKMPIVVFTHEKPAGLPAWTRQLSTALQDAITAGWTAAGFTGKAETYRFVYAGDGSAALLVGLGSKRRLDAESLRRAYGTAVTAARREKITKLAAPALPGTEAAAVAENTVAAVIMANYEFNDYRTSSDAMVPQLDTFMLWEPDGNRRRRMAKGVESGTVLGESTCRVRDLVNMPANDLYPQPYATLAGKLCREAGVKLQVLGLKEIKREKMGAVMAVGGGSDHEPQFLIMQYTGRKRQPKATDVALVGKGVTFDSGGISIKPSADMWEMRGDMMGSAVMINTICAAARLNLPVNLIALTPLVENMPSGTAYRPGDVVRTMSGQTIEIISTDAEGRMILADALFYAQRFNPNVIVDCATLTGAMAVALGDVCGGYFATSDQWAKKLEKAASTSGEKVWRMPLDPEYDDKFRSPVADMRNGGGRYGGASIAARILYRFVGSYPWIHVDIAGVDLFKKGNPYCPAGASGFGVRLLVDFLRQK